MPSTTTPASPLIEIALLGPQRPAVLSALEARFTCHHVYAEADRLAFLAEHGARFRGAASHGMEIGRASCRERVSDPV